VIGAALLSLSVVTQVSGMLALRLSQGMRRLAYTAACLILIAVSVGCMAQALASGLSLAVGYGVWSGAGIALSAISSRVLFHDRLTRRQILGLVLVSAGVAAVRLGGAS
jgi:small multidrug resistance pump